MACTLFLFRHGEVDASWRGRIYGALDVPLSREGQRESSKAAERLSSLTLSAVVSSGLTRTEHLAGLLRAGRAQERRDDPDLRELDRGEWAGLHLAQLAKRSPGAWEAWFRAPGRVRPPGGESLADLRRRVLPRLSYWVRGFPGGSIALVTHGWVIRVLVCEVLGIDLDHAPRLDVRTGDVFRISWPQEGEPGRPVLEGFAGGAASTDG